MWFSSLSVISNRVKSLMLKKLIEIITEDEYGEESSIIFQTIAKYLFSVHV